MLCKDRFQLKNDTILEEIKSLRGSKGSGMRHSLRGHRVMRLSKLFPGYAISVLTTALVVMMVVAAVGPVANPVHLKADTVNR